MKLIISGSRGFNNYELLKRETLDFINSDRNINIISGSARGADKLGERLARECMYDLIIMPADWSKLGRKAGFIRNIEMAKIATHCISFWDNISNGTRNMILTAVKYNLITKVIRY